MLDTIPGMYINMSKYLTVCRMYIHFQVGPPGMFDDHCKLKEARQQERELLLEHQRCKELLEKEEKKNARLQHDVENYEQRQSFLKKVEMLKMKRAWVVGQHMKLLQQYMYFFFLCASTAYTR